MSNEAGGLSLEYFLWAAALGGLSAVSLPLGSATGLISKPRDKVTSVLSAFGGGALLAALAVELVAPTVMALGEHGATSAGHASGDGSTSGARAAFLAMVIGAVCGGVLFVVLDQLVNARGGFLRKSATTIAYFTKARNERNVRIVEELSKVAMIRELPPEQVNELVRMVDQKTFIDGETIFEQGDPGERMYFIHQGHVALYHDGQLLKELGPGEVLGEIALLTGSPRTARAVARGKTSALSLSRDRFEQLRERSPELDEAMRELAGSRLEELSEVQQQSIEAAQQWATGAAKALRTGMQIPTAGEIREASEKHHGAPLAIWLGILLDGIPESFVIGAAFFSILTHRIAEHGEQAVTFAGVVPYTLLAGLFLANFPEAMSSSIGMKAQGWSRWRVLTMWTTLTVVTAIGAGAGYLVGGAVSHTLIVGIEGLAAGAMLTMIAAAMIPEAVHLGTSNLVGLSTLGGFLSAVMFKLFE